MAKPIGPKTQLIRDALKAHPGMGNTELAETINVSPARKEDGIEVTAQDVAAQKQALKNLGETAAPAPKATPIVETAPAPAKKKGRPAGQPTKKGPATKPPSTATANGHGPVAMIDSVIDLAKQVGGIGELKHLVERIEQLQAK